MMISTLIAHGSFGNPSENWFPWLADILRKQGTNVITPHFPEGRLQNLDNWSRVLDSYLPILAPEVTIYAHSSAPSFIVDYCVRRNLSVHKAVFVAPFYDLIGIQEFDDVNNSFFVEKNYLNRFSELCRNVDCVYSDNDPYVPRSLSEDFCARTKAKVHVVPGGKHLNTSAGYREFPELLML